MEIHVPVDPPTLPQNDIHPSAQAIPEQSSDYDDLISKMKHNNGTIEDFKELMYKCQTKRKEFVSLLLEQCSQDNDYQNQQLVNVANECLHFLNETSAILDNGPSHMKEISSTNEKNISIFIKDEFVGMKKDIEFLHKLCSFFSKSHGISVSKYLTQMDFLAVLPSFHHSIDFLKEHADCVGFLEKLKNGDGMEVGFKPILITDWDGTMKDYCAQYATNLQPIYSAISLANFSQAYTRHSAVLTAGPLSGPGILDLIALPRDGPIVFSGSWGREWWFDGKRIVHDETISHEGSKALDKLSYEVTNLLNDDEFAHFALIGSGVQRKVDRLTLGIQTVNKHVAKELSVKYQNEIKQRMYKVDPDSQFLHFESSPNEVEVVVHNGGPVWDKADGMAKIMETLGDSLENGKVLICGDTRSDVPMLTFGRSKNKTGVMALFVTDDKELQQKVVETVGDRDRCCFVSTPDVIHASMMTILLKAQQTDNAENELEKKN